MFVVTMDQSNVFLRAILGIIYLQSLEEPSTLEIIVGPQ